MNLLFDGFQLAHLGRHGCPARAEAHELQLLIEKSPGGN